MPGFKKDWYKIVQEHGYRFVSVSQRKIKFEDDDFTYECYKNCFPPSEVSLLHYCTTPVELFIKRFEDKQLPHITFTIDEDNFDRKTLITFVCTKHNQTVQRTALEALRKTFACRYCAKNFYNGYEGLCDILEEKFDGRYTCYEETYKNSQTPAKFNCNLHGDFWKKPTVVLNKRACPDCKKEDLRLERQQEFIRKAIEVHGDYYSYEDSLYVHSLKPVNIFCKEHGMFNQIPRNHLTGHGCRLCAFIRIGEKLTASFDSFLEEAVKVHGNKYTYIESTYKSMCDHIDIICPQHGVFRQIAQSHKKGSNCPECAKINLTGRGWTRTLFEEMCKDGYATLYCFEVMTKTEKFLKIGITSKAVEGRRTEIKKDIKDCEVLCIASVKAPAKQVFDMEVEIIRKFATEKYVPNIKFGGWTECFSYDSLPYLSETIIQFFDEVINE